MQSIIILIHFLFSTELADFVYVYYAYSKQEHYHHRMNQ